MRKAGHPKPRMTVPNANKHAMNIDSLEVIARRYQKTNGSMRDELNGVKMEVAQGPSLHDMRLSEVESGYNSLNEWAG